MALSTEVQQRVARQFPAFANLIQVPDLADLLAKASDPANQWDATKLQTELWATKWWQTTPESARRYQIAASVDPAEASKLAGSQREQISTLISKMGLSIPPEQLAGFAIEALNSGYNEDQLRQRAVDMAFKSAKIADIGGDAGALRDQLKKDSSDYGLLMSDQALGRWTQDIMAGRQTLDGYRTNLRGNAKGLYAQFADDLDRGATIRQLADPYIQLAAQRLEISPDQVDITDPKWGAALNSIDKDTGKRRAMTLAEWETTLRTDDKYGYNHTKQASNAAYELAQGLGQRMGRVG